MGVAYRILGYLDNAATMPRAAVVTTPVIRWIAITASVVTVNLGAERRPLLDGLIIALGLIGTFFVLRMGHRQRPEAAGPQSSADLKT